MLTKKLIVPEYLKPDLNDGFAAAGTLRSGFSWRGCVCSGRVILLFPFSFPI